MGTTCRTYNSKEKISLSKAYEVLNVINHHLCLGEQKTLRYSSRLNSIDLYQKFKNEFPSDSNIMVGFKVKSPQDIYEFISDATLYNKCWFFIHLIDPPIDSSHSSSYWIDLDTSKEFFKLRLNLPSASGIEICKEELVKMLSYLFEKNILNVTNEKAKQLAHQLLEPSRNKHNSSEIYNEFKYWASGLSSVILYFQKEQFERFGGYLKMAARTTELMDEYFSGFNSYLQGTFICNEGSKAMEVLNRVNFKELQISVHLNLLTQELQNIEAFYNKYEGEEFDIRLENFDWLFSDISNGDNLLNIYIDQEKSVRIEIEIDKHIEDDYIQRIEKISGVSFT